MKISKTPETDGHLIEVLDVTGKVVVTDKVYAGFARKLEIERNELQTSIIHSTIIGTILVSIIVILSLSILTEILINLP